MPKPFEDTVASATSAVEGDIAKSSATVPAREYTPRTAPERPLWKAFWVFLGPLLVGSVLQLLMVTINNIYIGQMVGVKALAAVTAFFPVLFLFLAFATGLGAGSAVVIGQAWGERRVDTVREVAGTTLTVGLLLGVVFGACGLAFTEPLLRALGTPPDILPDALRAVRVILAVLPALFAFILATAGLRGVGDTITPLYALLLFTVVGLVGTPALIRGWLGLPRLGVTSGVWATVVAVVLGSLWVVLYLRYKNSPLKPDAEFLRHMHLNPRLIKTVLRVGLPTSMNMIVVAVAELALLSMVNRYGSDATAAYGAVSHILSYVQIPATSISVAASILGAQIIGAGRTDQLNHITRTAMLMNLLLTGMVIALCYLFSRQVIGLFITSAPIVRMAQTLLWITLWSVVILGMGMVFSGVMRASGTVLAPMLISIGCILLVQVPTGWIASRLIGLNGVWLAYPAVFCSMALLQWAYYQGVWRKQKIKRLV